jgi:hypothetical protein
MTIRNLLRLARRGAATLTVAGGEAAVSSGEIVRPVTRYDLIADAVNAKIKRLQHPDPRFLRHASPIPSLVDHTSILAAPETRVTTLPNGLRVATESTLASKTATVSCPVSFICSSVKQRMCFFIPLHSFLYAQLNSELTI